jgi:hypothetical protein
MDTKPAVAPAVETEDAEIDIVELLDDLDIVAIVNCHHPMVDDEQA